MEFEFIFPKKGIFWENENLTQCRFKLGLILLYFRHFGKFSAKTLSRIKLTTKSVLDSDSGLISDKNKSKYSSTYSSTYLLFQRNPN